MKRLLLAILMSATAIAAPTPTPKPSVDLTGVTAADIRKTEEHRNQLLKQQADELAAEKADHLKVGTALADATQANLKLQRDVDEQTKRANKVQGQLDEAMKKLWWYRLRWWGSWIALGLCVATGVILWIAKRAGKFALAP